MFSAEKARGKKFPEFCQKLWEKLSSIPNLKPKDLEALASFLSIIKGETVENITNILLTEIRLGKSQKEPGRSAYPDKQAKQRFITYLNTFDLSDDDMNQIDTAKIVKINLLGQALLVQKPKSIDKDLKEELRDGVSFTGLETAIQGEYKSQFFNKSTLAHIAKPDVLDVLQSLGINLVGASNNHISDYGLPGIQGAIDEMKKRGMIFAGIGVNGEDAMKHALFIDPKTGVKIALLSVVTGAIRFAERAKAIAGEGPGLNAIQRSDGRLNKDQVSKNIAAVQKAAKDADLVIFYHHNHYDTKADREMKMDEIADWWKEFSHQIIDAGAHIYISHGSPVVQPYEIYNNSPVFYGEGNLFFQTRKPQAYAEGSWHSNIRKVKFLISDSPKPAHFIGLDTVELQLNNSGKNDKDFDVSNNGLPSVVRKTRAKH